MFIELKHYILLIEYKLCLVLCFTCFLCRNLDMNRSPYINRGSMATVSLVLTARNVAMISASSDISETTKIWGTEIFKGMAAIISFVW